MPINQLDLPAIHGAAMRTKQMQRQNQMASELGPLQIEGARTQNLLAQQQLEAARQPKPIDPEDVRRAVEWGDTPEKWDQAVDVFVQEGNPQFARYRGQFHRREELKALLAAQPSGKPLSGPGKVATDIEAGILPAGTPLRGKGVTVNLPGQPQIGKIPAGYQAVQDKAGGWRMEQIPGGPPAEMVTSKLLDMDLETISGTRESVKAGEDFMPRLEVIVQGLESGNVETGRWQEATLPIRQWAQSAGWTDDPSLGEQEAVLAAISYMIPRMRVVGSGQTSDVEIKLFSQATAQYSNTPQGNILIARTMMQIQDRNKELLAAQRAWVRKNKTLEGFDADDELGPMFPKVTTQEDADRLPSGTVFIHTVDGRFKVKR